MGGFTYSGININRSLSWSCSNLFMSLVSFWFSVCSWNEAPPANLCFSFPGLDAKHSYTLENLKYIITKFRKSWISLSGGAGTAEVSQVWSANGNLTEGFWFSIAHTTGMPGCRGCSGWWLPELCRNDVRCPFWRHGSWSSCSRSRQVTGEKGHRSRWDLFKVRSHSVAPSG